MHNNADDLPRTSPPLRPFTDGNHFRTIAGRKLSDRILRSGNYGSAKSLHEGQRKQFEAMPDLSHACEQLACNVESEMRRDDVIKLSELRIDAVGDLITPLRAEIIPGVPHLRMMEHAWSQLVSRAPGDVPRRLRSNVNTWLRDSKGSAVARTMEAPSGQAQDCFAMVSERYQPHDAHLVAREVARAMPSECKGEIKYKGDGGRYEIEAVLARPFKVDGDIHRVIVNVRSADNGTLSQIVSFKVWRLKCLNGMFVADKHLLRRVRHTGDAGKLRDQFAHGLAMAREAIESFQAHWSRANSDSFVDATSGANLNGPEALRRLVGRGDINVPNVGPADLMDRFRSSWEAEPGDSVADVLNAVTRAAHVNTWTAAWTTEALEQVAGQLLYTHTRTLPALTPKQTLALAS